MITCIQNTSFIRVICCKSHVKLRNVDMLKPASFLETRVQKILMINVFLGKILSTCIDGRFFEYSMKTRITGKTIAEVSNIANLTLKIIF